MKQKLPPYNRLEELLSEQEIQQQIPSGRLEMDSRNESIMLDREYVKIDLSDRGSPIEVTRR